LPVRDSSHHNALVMLSRLRLALLWAFASLAFCVGAADPQTEAPNGALLVARPSLLDPNFSQTVVLVTQRPDGSTVGVILNRPTKLALAPLVPGLPAANYKDAVYFGGPVTRRNVFVVFESASPPEASAFHVLRGIYMSLQIENIARLLERGGSRYRLYAGFSGWAPGQLEGEFLREGWFVLPADEEVVFRHDTRGMWEALVTRALGRQAEAEPRLERPTSVGQIESPTEVGL
jgi:putative transcriptional regulator